MSKQMEMFSSEVGLDINSTLRHVKKAKFKKEPKSQRDLIEIYIEFRETSDLMNSLGNGDKRVKLHKKSMRLEKEMQSIASQGEIQRTVNRYLRSNNLPVYSSFDDEVKNV